MSSPSIIDASEWNVGHPSQNKSFVATVVIASLLITGFFIGCGFMIYYWVRSWRSKDADNYKPNSSGEINEKGSSNVDVDLEAQRQRPGTPPPERTYESEDESPIVQVSRWRQETVSLGGSESSRSQSSRSQSEASSTRSSSDLSSVEGHLPERPRSRDFHELYPSN